MVSARTSLAHGPSRIVWVYRNRGAVALAIGWLSVYEEGDGGGRHQRIYRLLPFRHLVPGRYDLMMARYGEAWPVTLARDEDAEDERMMVVTGRVPL